MRADTRQACAVGGAVKHNKARARITVQLHDDDMRRLEVLAAYEQEALSVVVRRLLRKAMQDALAARPLADTP